MPMPVKIFFSYAREDENLLNKLKTHLESLKRAKLIDVWYDRNISAGTEWKQQIERNLNDAQIILLLVSADFMNSRYCYGVEMKRALERHEKGEARVIPIVLRPVVDWKEEPIGKLQALPKNGRPVTDRHWHNLEEALLDVTLGIRGAIEEWNQSSPPVDKFDLFHTLTGHPKAVTSLAASPDGKHLVSGGDDGTIQVWDLSTGKMSLNLSSLHESVYSVAFSPDNRILVSGGWDHKIRVWGLPPGKLIRTLTGHKDIINSVAISPDGMTLVSGSSDRTIKIWNLHTGEARHSIDHEKAIYSVAISPDGKTLVSGSAGNILKIWNLHTYQEIRTLNDFSRASIYSLAISPDGKILVSGSADSTIKIWNLHTGDAGYTLSDHTRAVNSVAISADGQVLVSGSADKTIRIWDLSAGKEMQELIDLAGPVKCVIISPDGKSIFNGNEEGTIRVWRKKP